MASVKPFLAPLQPSSLQLVSRTGTPTAPLLPRRSQLHFPLLPSPRSIPSSPAFSSPKKAVEAPPEPMPWVWSCHKCHTRYPLGATRRCLHDGHYFCGGITVNKITGKTKKHRACASEFDFISWDRYGKWKRRVAKVQPLDEPAQHCEHKCDFPSACHWKSQNTPKKTANFDFVDPKSLGAKPAVNSTASGKEYIPTSKKTGLYIEKIVKAAEKRTSQLTTLLSTIEEERNFTSMPGYVPPSTNAPPKLPELPSLQGLGLSFPVMDFSMFKKQLDDHHNPLREVKTKDATPEQSPPESSASVSTAEDDDGDGVHMTNWLLNHPPPYSPPISPTSKTDLDDIPFDFSIDPTHAGHGPDASLADNGDDEDESPISPRRNAWDWTAGDIGIALGSPTKPAYEEIWEEPMKDETEKGLGERLGSFG